VSHLWDRRHKWVKHKNPSRCCGGPTVPWPSISQGQRPTSGRGKSDFPMRLQFHARYGDAAILNARIKLQDRCMVTIDHPSRPPRVEWSRDRWRHVTPGNQGLDSKLFEALRHHSHAKHINYNWLHIKEHYVSNKTANANAKTSVYTLVMAGLLLFDC